MEARIIQKAKEHPLLKKTMAVLRARSDVYLVGGSLRDFALNREPCEFDFISRAPFKCAATAAKAFRSRAIRLGKGLNVIYRVPLKQGNMDFSAFEEKTIKENLLKRDFTVNSLALHLKSLKLFDPENSLGDLRDRILREGYKNAFPDDPLRIVKGYRMRASFPILEWDGKTRESVRKEASTIIDTAPERIRSELAKILESNKSAFVVREMAEDEVLFVLFPELKGMENLAQSRPHKSDVLTHTFEMLDILDKNREMVVPPKIKPLSKPELSRLRLAVLFHDSGKPKCVQKDEKGVHFIGHPKFSSSIATECLSRLRFSNAVINDVAKLVGLHMRPLLLFQEGKPSASAKRRLIRDAGGEASLLLLLSLLDFCSMDRTKAQIKKYNDFYREVLGLVESEGNRILNPPKLIDGIEAMKILGLKTGGPALGKALLALLNAQTDGAVATTKEAAAFLKSYKKKRLPA